VVLLLARRRLKVIHRSFDVLMSSPVTSLNEQQENYVRTCWLNELLEARIRSRRNRGWFLLWRFLAVSGALVLPALASLNLGNATLEVRIATFIVSIIVAVSTGAIQVFRFGSNWMLDEWYANALETEGWRISSRRPTIESSIIVRGSAMRPSLRELRSCASSAMSVVPLTLGQ
jgi:Protein of unknown function (DUF4231)